MALNLLCPYDVRLTEDEDSQIYSFQTAAGSLYKIAFQKVNGLLSSTALEGYDCFNIIISRNNQSKLKSDRSIRDTVEAVLVHFFKNENRLLIYQYDNNDGKRKARSRLFSIWYEAADSRAIIQKLESTIKANDAETYVVGLFHHVNHTISGSTIRDEFNSIIYVLNAAKDSQDEVND